VRDLRSSLLDAIPLCTPDLASHRAAAGNCHGIPAWGGDTASIVNSPVCSTQKYLTGAEVERLMVMILLAEVILIIPALW
jgi:hypothetical protein